jgi:hypothetical protein
VWLRLGCVEMRRRIIEPVDRDAVGPGNQMTVRIDPSLISLDPETELRNGRTVRAHELMASVPFALARLRLPFRRLRV